MYHAKLPFNSTRLSGRPFFIHNLTLLVTSSYQAHFLEYPIGRPSYSQDASRNQRFVYLTICLNLCSCSSNLFITGVLIECDPSIKSIIVSIDSANHDYIIEDLDDERVVVKENMVSMLKAKLEDVRILFN
jgi:TFIIH basal transcription factor complex TTD-A subunit